MKRSSIISLACFLTIVTFSSIQFSCNKGKQLTILPDSLKVSFPLLNFNHNQYYTLDHDVRSVELVFNQKIQEETVAGNLDFSDKNGSLAANYDLVVDGSIIFIRLHTGFYLADGWKYELTILTGLKSAEGNTVVVEKSYQFRTTSKHLSDFTVSGTSGDSLRRTLIACISDIHCGDQRANDQHYSWFAKNASALEDFLIYVKNNPRIKELVILGDLFDEWMVPYYVAPFDSLINIKNSGDYFKAIANSIVNKPIFNQINEIISSGEVEVVYVPGNHDMLITEDLLNEIIPGISWQGQVSGLGKYNPVPEIAMEHGHRYDFFNCPQPLVNDGHIIPPGYFVTRLYAAGLANASSGVKNQQKPSDDAFEFITAWSVAFGYTLAHFNMDADTIQMDSSKVQMSGVDGYATPMSFNGARDLYAANIEANWPGTQQINQVPVPLDVFLAILNGTYLYGAALFEYLTDYLAPDQPKVVAFGHSHEPDIKVFPLEDYYTGIYANSGSWIDPDQSNYKTRTFLVINPGNWSGSDLDVVSLYQYNLDSDQGGQTQTWKPVLIKEESIEKE
jgi:UDP-2,3-diacylglucosamine pyrophosphatase LpxH